MHKKKIITIGPVSAQPEDLASIANTLSFLDDDYDIDYADSLSIMQELPNPQYYKLWQQELAHYLEEYDAFFGFSFGGVIIQQCLHQFIHTPKPIILFSTPTFADHELKHKLGKVIDLCQEQKLEAALEALYEPVFYPNPMPPLSLSTMNQQEAFTRLIFGLTRVLKTDCTNLLKTNQVPHTHLIGEYSHLVNINNVIAPRNGRLIVVPKASMRVLQDNRPFCEQIIREALHDEVR